MLRVFWIFPIGEDLEEEVKIARDILQGYLRGAAFVGKTLEIPERVPLRGTQIEARALLKLLPNSPGYKIGITSEDIFVYGTNFIFGLASPAKMKAVISVNRLRSPDQWTYFSRIGKEVIHEVGHLLGLEHCQDPFCVMFFSNTLMDTDRKGWKFCPYCLEKLKKKGIYVNESFTFYRTVIKMFRAFIAVEIPFNESLKKFWREISSSGARLKMVEPENVHLTLKFLGNIQEELIPEVVDAISNSSSGISKFKILLKGCGGFPTPHRPRVVWIGISEGGEILKGIASKLERELGKLGFPRERREFVPHITIARIKGGVGRIPEILERYKNEIFGEVEVKEIRLMKSTLTPSGPIYEVVRSVKLE